MSLFEELFWWIFKSICAALGHDRHMITADNRGEVCVRCGKCF